MKTTQRIWNGGGITRDALLIEEPAVRVQDPVQQLKKGRRQRLAGRLQFNGAAPGERVTARTPKLALQPVLDVETTGGARCEVDAPGLQRGSPEAPKLYSVQLCRRGQTLRDNISFRSIKTRGADILPHQNTHPPAVCRPASPIDETHG